MVTILRSKFGIPISDIFFAAADTPPDPHSALSLFVQARNPQPGFVPFRTHIIDLSQSPGLLFERISSNGRYRIRRAEREGCIPSLTTTPSEVDLERFCRFFDGFSRQKSLPRANRAKLRALKDAGALIISSVTDGKDSTLAMHAYVRDPLIRRARLLYSASHFRGSDDSGARNLIGRANRLLHWHEIELLHGQRYLQYDLGGVTSGDEDPAKAAIARFKREFGGSEVTEFNGYRPNSMVGKAALALMRRGA